MDGDDILYYREDDEYRKWLRTKSGSDGDGYHKWLRTASRAVELPDLRLWLLDQWKDPHSLMSIAANQAENEGNHDSEAEIHGLAKARLFFATRDICTMVSRRSVDFPLDIILEPDFVPYPTGLVYFEEPLRYSSHVGLEQLLLRAILWMPDALDSVRIGCYVESHVISDDGVVEDDILIAEPQMWWYRGDNVEPGSMAAEPTDLNWAWASETRRIIGTFWKVMQAPRLVEEIICYPQRGARRRSERRKLHLDADVRVIDIHAPKYRSSTQATGRDVEWSCRWPVTEHWAWRRCGKDHMDRRRVLIPEYPKGPVDKPWKEKEIVYKASKKNMGPID